MTESLREARKRPVQTALIPGCESPVGPIPESVARGDNAALIASIAPLYLTGSVLDVTYGRGAWWRRVTPATFGKHDIALDGVDFRALPEASSSWDAVCFDPPYVPRQGVAPPPAPRGRELPGPLRPRRLTRPGRAPGPDRRRARRVRPRRAIVGARQVLRLRERPAVPPWARVRDPRGRGARSPRPRSDRPRRRHRPGRLTDHDRQAHAPGPLLPRRVLGPESAGPESRSVTVSRSKTTLRVPAFPAALADGDGT